MKRSALYIFILLLVSGGCSEKKKTAFHSPNFDLVELTHGVYGCIHKTGGKAICNAGFVDNGRETIVFDCFLAPSVADEMITAIHELGLSPIKYVVNSHAHNDHVRGNQAFPPEVRIISTTRTAELIAEWEPREIEAEKQYAPQRLAYYDSLYQAFEGDTTSREFHDIIMWRPYFEVLAASYKEIKTRLPDMFVDSTWTLKGPSRTIQLVTMGAGHTESDLVMYLPEDSILFAGDLVFHECHPYMADGSVNGMKNWLVYLNSLKVNTVVPGHGPIGSGEAISMMISYVNTLENLAVGMHESLQSVQDVNDIDIPKPYGAWWFDRFFYSNLRFAYHALE